jgi:Rps23 Pro-64 3,4-dihydroxylase Tpa1-like proline 4-hydroxylase
MLSKEILAPGIVLYRTDPFQTEEILDKVKSTLINDWRPSEVVNTETYTDELNLFRKCEDCGLDKSILDSDNEEKKDLYLKTEKWIDGPLKDFIAMYQVEETVAGPFVYIKYEKSDNFGHHIDDGKRYPRTVSISAYLNDDYSGGELEFKHFNLTIKPKKGDIVVFSSAFPYMHKVNPVIEGTRYAIVNWYRYATYPEMME